MEDLHEGAATCGLVAAAEAVERGHAQGLTHADIARDAHQAAELAYQAFVASAQHAGLDASVAEGEVIDAEVVGENEPIVGATAIERHHGVGAPLSVGHGGGHGGGGHGGHGHGHHDTFLLGGWPPDYYYDAPVVLACGPGQLLLADGTCFDPSVYGHRVGGPDVGAELGDAFLPVSDDGSVVLPDGTTVHVDSIDWGHTHTVGAVLVGQSQHHAHVGDGTSSFPPYTGGGDNLGPAAVGTGSASTSPEADTIEANWAAVLQAKAQIPGWTAANTKKLTSDHTNWEQFYAHIKNGETLYLFQDLSPWQAIVNEWGDAMRAMAPNRQSWPTNFPTTPGGAGLSTTPVTVPSLPDPSGLASALQWGVIAVAVGVGLWLFWPVLVGAKGLMATL